MAHKEFTEGYRKMPATGKVSKSCLKFMGVFASLLLLWIAFSWFVVPAVIESAYRGESLPFLNSLISGQAKHSVEHYLASWEKIGWRVLGTLFGIGIIAVLFGVFLDHTNSVPSGIKILFATDCSLSLAYLLLVSVLPQSSFMGRFLDLSAEANLPTWYSSTKLFLIAVLLSIFACNKCEKAERGKWALVLAPVVFAFLSLDETAGIHEWLGYSVDSVILSSGNRKNSLLPQTGAWMFVLAPLFLGGMVFIGRSARHYLDKGGAILRKYMLGIVVFVGSAAGIEIIRNFVSKGEMAYIIQVFCEELGEMLGGTILLWATWDLLVSHQLWLSVGGSQTLKKVSGGDGH